MRNGNNTYMDVEAEEYSGRSHLVGFIFQIQFNWADDITGDQLYQAAVMTRIWESRSLISPPWIGRAVFFFLFFFVFFPVDISGIKAIKIKLAETLAINENWILTKPFICHVCFMWSQLHQCDVQFNRLCRWGGSYFHPTPSGCALGDPAEVSLWNLLLPLFTCCVCTWIPPTLVESWLFPLTSNSASIKHFKCQNNNEPHLPLRMGLNLKSISFSVSWLTLEI